MIGLRNRNEIEERMHVHGSQSVADFIDAVTAPLTGTISAIWARTGSAGVTGSQVTDVLLNGVSIFSSGGLTFPDGVATCTYGVLAVNPVKVKKGDVIRLNTTAVHSGTAAKLLQVYLVFRRGTDAKAGQATQTDTLSSDSDAA